MHQFAPRIPPVSFDASTDEQKALLGGWRDMNFAAVMVTHPDLYRTLVPLIAKLIASSKLPPRDREILVLRTLGLCDELYESQHHVSIARNAGMSDAEIEQAKAGRGAGLSAFDQSLVRAAEELARDRRVGDATWRELAERYSLIELMEVVSLVGLYTLMAMVTKSFGIQPEDARTFESFTKVRHYK